MIAEMDVIEFASTPLQVTSWYQTLEWIPAWAIVVKRQGQHFLELINLTQEG